MKRIYIKEFEDFSSFDGEKSEDSECNFSEEEEEKKDVKAGDIVVNIARTQYNVVREVAKKHFHFQLTKDPSLDWDLCWVDTGVTIDTVLRMKPYQKINHFPGMTCLARKNNLYRNLFKMKKAFPKEYNFIPQTWLLPQDWTELKNDMLRNKKATYIVKPEAMSQGKGIFLTQNFEMLQASDHYVVQKYLKSPYLIEGLKFDLRIYALVYGCDPLRIFVHKEGLVRLSTDPYVPPNKTNLNNLFMHLTNYAINKKSDNYVFNENAENAEEGHKRSLEFLWDYVEQEGFSSKLLKQKINRIIVKTLCAVQPQLANAYKTAQPLDDTNSLCFEILGFDILLDSKLKPWLLEVNHSPSFTTDTPFDEKVKFALLSDTFQILHLDPAVRKRYYSHKQIEFNAKALGRPCRYGRASREEREDNKEFNMESRDFYERMHSGGYSQIYPNECMRIKFESYLAHARLVWDDSFGLHRAYRVAPKKPVKEKTIKEPSSILMPPRPSTSITQVRTIYGTPLFRKKNLVADRFRVYLRK